MPLPVGNPTPSPTPGSPGAPEAPRGPETDPSGAGGGVAPPVLDLELDWADMANQIRQLLTDLIPEAGATITWHDIGGHKHQAPLILSGRRQFLLMVRMEALGPTLLARLRQMAGLRGDAEAAAGAMMVLARMVTDQTLADVVRDLFTLIHPKAVAKSLELGTEPDVDLDHPDEVGPYEVFALEEVLRAIVPFLLGPLRELIGTVLPALERALRQGDEVSH